MKTFRQHLDRLLLAVLLVLAGAAPALPQPTPTPFANPASILFLSLNPRLDATYRTQLEDQGVAVALANLRHRIEPAFFRRFNVIVIDQTVQAGNEYELFGQNTVFYRENLKQVADALHDGAGVLVYPNLSDLGGVLALGFNADMAPFGLGIHQASAIDFERGIHFWTAYGTNAYTWTEALADHPVTENINRIYYAGGNARWDDCYLTPPLNLDSNWTVLVKGMPGSMIAINTDHQWSRLEGAGGAEVPVLAAVRDVGRGRMAAFALSPNYVHRHGHARLEKGAIGEQSVGIIDGIVLEKGDGDVPSDTGRFVLQLYRWLGANSAAAGLGGYRDGDPVLLADTGDIQDYEPVLDLEHMTLPPSWKHRATRVWRGSGQADYPELADPVVPGDIRFFKGLIGARTALSDGAGTVAEYAAAARDAGYALLVFTETFEHLSAENYERLIDECRQQTTDDLVCLPGFDIRDRWGNHFLVIAAPFYPRSQWLSDDGRRLAHPAYINLCYGNHLVVAHRTTLGSVPNELLKHWQGFTVFTYRDGQQIEDATAHYNWQAESAGVPHPIVVHELFSPADVARAALNGYQQILPSDTPANAAGYFRIGLAHYFEAPSRYLLSEGPIATTWIGLPKDAGPAAENRDFMRIDLAVTNDRPLAVVELRDGPHILRRWLPNENTFATTTFLRHDRQRSMYLAARDRDGRGMLTSVLRSVPQRYHFRCADRQNWLGHVTAWYPGTHLPLNLGANFAGIGEAPSAGTPGQCMAPKLEYPFTTPDVVALRAVLDQTYAEATRANTWGDARPAYPTQPSQTFAGTVTAHSFNSGQPGRTVISMVEYDLVLKTDLTLPDNPDDLMLHIAGVRADTLLWSQPGGILATNIGRGVAIELPVHALGGGFIPLTPGFGIAGRSFGLRRPADADGILEAGHRVQGRFLMTSEGLGVTARYNQSFHADATRWMEQFGFLGSLPYSLKLSTGRIDTPSFPIRVMDRKGLLKGRVTRAATNMFFNVPLAFRDLNPNWPAGIWQTGAPGIAYTGIDPMGRAWPRLDVTRTGDFVAGQLVTASDPEAVITVVAWTRQRVRLDLHNPTDRSMRLRVRTANIPGYRSLSRRISLPPGSSQRITR